MIQFTLKDNEFSYDIKALAMAFFPEKTCVVKECPEWLEKDGYTVRMEIDGEVRYEKFFPVPYTKNEVKRHVYDFFSGYAGKTLAWGILTGIRPAKIPLRLRMDGREEEEILKVLTDEYRCPEKKARLAWDVAEKEYALTSSIPHEESINLYVGIPFCPSICAYCSFSSYSVKQYEDKVDAYLDALEKEMEYAASVIHDKILQTVYIGGGTPTSLNESQFARLLDLLDTYFPMENIREYTVEAGRPDSITEGKLCSMKQHGVTRISINPQSMKQETLELLGRKHTVEQVKEVFFLARKSGFNNINMDIIVGLPGETLEDLKQTLEQVEELAPDSITIHTLVIKRASRLRKEQMERGGEIAEEESRIPQMQDFAEKFCRENGYEPYYMYRQKNKAGTTRNTNQENVAYARPGKECLYNIFMMEELETILALGSGGSSKYVYHGENRMERVENVKSVEDYISRIDEMIDRKKKEVEVWH